MEKKLETLLRDFEYHARETVNAVQDRAAAQKLSKDAERRIAKLRREFREQFDSTVVAHSTGADRGDPNAQPQVVKHVSEGDTVKLKSVGRAAVVSRRIDENHFEVEIGAMKMKIARDDIAEVLVAAADSPVKAARARGISVSLEKENAERAVRNQRHRPHRGRRHPRSREIRGSRVPGRTASSARSARQRHGNSAQSAAAVSAEASACRVGDRASQNERRGDGGDWWSG